MDLVHRDPARADALDELEAQPTFTNSGFTDHADDLPVRSDRAGEDPVEPGELNVPSDQPGQAPRARGFEPRASGPDPAQLDDADRRRHPLYRLKTGVFEHEEPLDEPSRRLGEQYGARGRQLLHARREADRVALGRVVHAQIVADLPDDHLARVDAHPHRELDPASPERVRIGSQLVHRRERGVTGAAAVVLVSDGSPEERHHAVSGELVDRALESVDACGENLEDAIENAMPVFGVDAVGEAHRIDHIDKEDAHLLALPFESATRGEDLLGEVARGIGTCIARRRRRAAARRE